MIQFDFISYMRDEIAKKLKDIGHTDENNRFFRISGIGGLEEFIAEMPDNQYPALMVVENQEGRISDNRGDNFTDTPGHEFYIVQNYNHGDHNARSTAKKTCKLIGQKILSRMLRDKSQQLHGLNFLKFTDVPYYTIGPFGDQVIAVYFRIENNQSANIVYNPDDWNA